jgi:hypothetical protein
MANLADMAQFRLSVNDDPFRGTSRSFEAADFHDF